jgi:hypothetical protein
MMDIDGDSIYHKLLKGSPRKSSEDLDRTSLSEGVDFQHERLTALPYNGRKRVLLAIGIMTTALYMLTSLAYMFEMYERGESHARGPDPPYSAYPFPQVWLKQALKYFSGGRGRCEVCHHQVGRWL